MGPISPISALPGTSRTLISVVLLLGVALLMGFRPVVDPAAWLAALGVIALFTVAVTWMGVAFGLVGKTPAGANSRSLSFLLLAFTSSAFVRPETMPAGARWPHPGRIPLVARGLQPHPRTIDRPNVSQPLIRAAVRRAWGSAMRCSLSNAHC
jgi:hypothetical protein